MDLYQLKKIEPGKVLQYEFMDKYNLKESQVAKSIGVSKTRINQICCNKRQITPDTAVRLSRLFNNSPKYWLDLQVNYNIEVAKNNLEGITIIPVC